MVIEARVSYDWHALRHWTVDFNAVILQLLLCDQVRKVLDLWDVSEDKRLP